MLESTRTGGRRIGRLTRLAVIGLVFVAFGASCTSNRADTGESATSDNAGGSTSSSGSASSSVAGSDRPNDSSDASDDTSAEPSSSNSAATSPTTDAVGSSVTDSPTTVATTPTTPAPTTTTAAPTTTLPPTTTTTIVTAGAIVIVANATDVPGGASQMSELLGRAGFQMAAPTDAGGNEEYRDTSQVYVKPGSEAVGGSVALLLGNVPVNYMPTPAPITDATVGLGDASVLVMLGMDLAGTTPPELANR